VSRLSAVYASKNLRNTATTAASVCLSAFMFCSPYFSIVIRAEHRR
jgi:hypothetical protein